MLVIFIATFCNTFIMLHNTIFPDIFSKLIHAPIDTIQYFIDLKQAHNSVEKKRLRMSSVKISEC